MITILNKNETQAISSLRDCSWVYTQIIQAKPQDHDEDHTHRQQPSKPHQEETRHHDDLETTENHHPTQESAPTNVAVTDMIKNDIKTLDFFRSILTKFRLVMVPSKDVSNQFVIKPWEDYIGTGDVFDWTNKLDYNMDVVLKPIFFSQSSVIEFKDQEDQDQYNYQFQQQNNHV